ncbi:MAG: sel1 repeat family protein [Bacteroides sp.]|nr:sel1 repeat family protein [Bacteroides sp.]
MKRLISFIAFINAIIISFAQTPDPLLLKKATKGNTDAQNELGVFYMNNNNVMNAIEWWEKAADKGHRDAMANLGEYYFNSEDYIQAIVWLSQASEKGHPQATFRMAQCFKYGLGIQKEPQTALKLSLKAADKGNINAYLLTAIIYEEEDFGNYYLAKI